MSETAQAHDQHGGHHDDHGHGGVRKYVMVFVALCVLTAISFAVGNSPLMNTRTVGWALMIAVSCAKAMLVMGFFMHLIWEANWKYVLTIPATIMSLFLMLMLIPDIGQRTEKYTDERWNFAAAPTSSGDQHAESSSDEHDGADHEGEESSH